MTSSMGQLDWAVIIIYLIAVVGLGNAAVTY
jgi:hypothetical protein